MDEKIPKELLAGIAHKFGSNLTVIKWTTEALIDGSFGDLNKEQKDAIGEVKSNNEKMIASLNEFLDKQ